MQKLLYIFILILFVGKANAQEILGKVKDNKGEPVVNASIAILQNGKVLGECISDWDGNYSVKPLPSGLYDMEVKFTGYVPQKFTGLQVIAGGQNEVNVTLISSGVRILGCGATKKKMVDPYNHITSYTKEEIMRSPDSTVRKHVEPWFSGVYYTRRGSDIQSDGCHTYHPAIMPDSCAHHRVITR